MAIKYTQVINSFVSTEGSNGVMTNYVYYTILVVNTDGTSEIVEGKLYQVSHLLRYVRTPVDDLMELKETVKGLRSDINDIVDQKMKIVVDSLYPIPDIQNKNEVEAMEMLGKAGLIPVLDVQYPDSTPPLGIVRGFYRNSGNFKKVNIRVIHDIPEVEGLKREEALARLKEAGFTASVKQQVVSGKENGIVLSCSRADEKFLFVTLLVSSAIPETKGMPAGEAAKLLRDEGYDVIIQKQVDRTAPGHVIKWESIDTKRIRLFISIPAKYEARYVDVKWTNMQDSAEDMYGATAEFNNIKQELTIRISYTIGSKSKHQINGIALIKGLGNEVPSVNCGTMEPNTKGSMDITVPLKKPFEELPANMSFTLDTQYGLMKKRDAITLQFAFDW